MSKTYLITGAGSGIGRAIARKLAEGGNNCWLLGRNEKTLVETLRMLPKANHQILVADVRSKDSLMTASEMAHGSQLDGIVANAGIGGENHRGENDRWNEIVETNLSGTYHTVNAFLPFLKGNETAFRHITIISSVLARLGVVNYSAYCASKAGLLGLMRSWAMEFAPEKILVNAICPGWVNTQMAQDGLQGIADGIGVTKDEFYQMAMQSVPLRKMSEPEEVADLVKYLHHQQSVTGQTFDINGGAVMNS